MYFATTAWIIGAWYFLIDHHRLPLLLSWLFTIIIRHDLNLDVFIAKGESDRVVSVEQELIEAARIQLHLAGRVFDHLHSARLRSVVAHQHLPVIGIIPDYQMDIVDGLSITELDVADLAAANSSRGIFV